MEIQHGGQSLPDATPTGGPGATVLDVHDGTGISWTMTRVAGRVVAVPAVSVVGIPASGASGQVVGYGGSPGTGAWVTPPGAEIGYDQITSSVNVGASFTSIIPGTARTYDGSTVIAEFFAPYVVTPSVAGQGVQIALYDSTTAVINLGFVGTPAAANMYDPVFLRYRFTPSAGSHTYGIQATASSTTGTPQIAAGTTFASFAPAFLRITKV